MHYTSLTEKHGKQVHQMPSNKQNNQRHSTTGKIWIYSFCSENYLDGEEVVKRLAVA